MSDRETGRTYRGTPVSKNHWYKQASLSRRIADRLIAAIIILVCIPAAIILAPIILLMVLFAGPDVWTRVWTNTRIYVGLHPCADGHSYEQTATYYDRHRGPYVDTEGLCYTLYDLDHYECEDCYKTKNRRVNKRQKRVDATDIPEGVRR